MDIIADTHCHSLASGHAYSTIEEIMRAAAERKMFAVAVTDHGRLIPGSPANWYFENLRVLPRKINGVMLLKGAEANVSDYDGNIDLSEKDLRSLEWVVASMHKDVLSDPCSVDDCSRAWLNIAKNPRVNVIGHSGADKFKYDYEMLIPMFAQEGKLVEINNASFYVRRDSIENCKKIASFCSTSGPLFILGTLGITVFNDKSFAIVVLICHYLSAFLNGFIYRGKKTNTDAVLNLPLDCNDFLSKTICNSTLSMLNLCGYIVVFNLIIDLVLNSGILSCLPNTDFGFTAQALICGCIEMTRGCMMLSKISISKFLKCGLITFLVSISGMGILCQSMSFLSKCRIKAKTVVLQKFTHSLIALLLGTIAGLIFK